MHLLIESIINGVTTGSVFALLGVTFGLIYYMTRVFHLAFGSISRCIETASRQFR
jgi:branched-subunit amino acid ABC-type transport system permease component